MAKADNVVRLLLIEESVEEAEQVISILRNAGLAVRPVRAEDPEQSLAALGAQLDLVLVGIKLQKINAVQVLQQINKLGKDVPVLQLTDVVTADLVVKCMREGIRALALRSASDHLQSIVKRELEDLRARRSVRRLESALRDSERRAQMLMESSSEPIAYIHEGMHVRANSAYQEMFRIVEFDEIEGMPILDMIAGKDADVFKAVLREITKGEKPPEQLTLKAKRTDGSTFDAVMELSEASIDGEPCTQIVFRQQTVSAEIAEELDKFKRQDLVSGLLNRQTFTDELHKTVGAAVAGRTDQALAYIEIDEYKRHLDVIGVAGADELFGHMGRLIKAKLGPSDVTGRISDHTFGIIYAGRSHEDCAAAAQALLKSIAEHIFEAGQQSISLNCSAGLCLFTEKTSNAHDVMQRAADACRLAQNEGGNRIHVFDPAAKEKALEAEVKQWEDLIRHALTKEGFTLMYQPIVSLMGEPGERYEVLLRLKGPKGEVMPNVFFPVAERVGLLPHIDRWVISHIISRVAERSKRGIQTTFFVKIMPETVADGSILPWLHQQLKTAGVSGERLVFEMPESKVVTNLKTVRFFQRGLEQLRCGFALEQFGAGLQSFQLLKHVPAGIVKVDRSYMVDLAKSSENQAKIKELANLAREQGKMTVAEFVEDAASMAILFGAGVTLVQGNFLQEPLYELNYEFG
jgi:diguanylate cyclase (GGDEF)-like protein/PAS domain S-box-containing protein